MPLRLGLRNPVSIRETALNRTALQRVFSRRSIRKTLGLPLKQIQAIRTASWRQIITVLEQVDPQKTLWLKFHLKILRIKVKDGVPIRVRTPNTKRVRQILAQEIPIRDTELTPENILDIFKRAELKPLIQDENEAVDRLIQDVETECKRRHLGIFPPRTISVSSISQKPATTLFDLVKEALEQRALPEEEQIVLQRLLESVGE